MEACGIRVEVIIGEETSLVEEKKPIVEVL
jgi:hypothetical protein